MEPVVVDIAMLKRSIDIYIGGTFVTVYWQLICWLLYGENIIVSNIDFYFGL